MFSLLWSQNGTLIQGVNPAGIGATPQSNMIEGVVNEGIIFPGQTTLAQAITVTSSALYDGLDETLTNVKFYLDGDPASLVIIQGLWPTQGGGMQISFDQGLTYLTFLQGPSGLGDKNYPATWITSQETLVTVVSGIPVDLSAPGIIYATESLNLLLRMVVPAQATQYQVYLPTLQCDFDII